VAGLGRILPLLLPRNYGESGNNKQLGARLPERGRRRGTPGAACRGSPTWRSPPTSRSSRRAAARKSP